MAERSGPSAAPRRRRQEAAPSETAAPNEESAIGAATSSMSEAPPTGVIPLAIAKVYRLPFVDPDSVPGAGSSQGLLNGAIIEPVLDDAEYGMSALKIDVKGAVMSLFR